MALKFQQQLQQQQQQQQQQRQLEIVNGQPLLLFLYGVGMRNIQRNRIQKNAKCCIRIQSQYDTKIKKYLQHCNNGSAMAGNAVYCISLGYNYRR